jgi:hypothetical protein
MITDFSAPRMDYIFMQGDTFTDGFFVTEYDSDTDAYVPKNLTGVQIISTIKGRLSKDAPVMAQCTIGDGIEVTDGDGTMDFFQFKYTPVKTNVLPTRKIWMDIQMVFPDGTSTTYLISEIDVKGQATPHA